MTVIGITGPFAIFNNGKVAIAKGPLGLQVFADFDHTSQWVLLTCLEPAEFQEVESALDSDPAFAWYDEFWAAKKATKRWAT